MAKSYVLSLTALMLTLPLSAQVPLSSAPAQNAVDVALCSQITLTYPQGTNMVALQDTSALVVRGNLLGPYRSATEFLKVHATSVSFTPSCPFLPGELVTVTVTADSSLTPVSFQFRTTAQESTSPWARP